jgi:tol-pal system protein YbgF
MRKTFNLTMLVVVLALTAAPVRAADREHQQMMADIRMLQEQAQQLAIALATLNDALKAIGTTLNSRLDQQAEASRKATADQKLLIDTMSNDLRIIRERSDETNVRIATLDQEIEALRATITATQSGAAPPPAPTSSADPSASPTLPAVPPPASIAGLSPRRMMEQAFADYTAGQYSLAIQGYEAFIKTFPTADQTGDAQFYIGESYFQSGKHQDAINAYNDVIKLYPKSNAVPDAYYKRGLAQEKLGHLDAARESWQTVVKAYPESDAGRLAKQGLDRLAARKP